MLKRNSINKLCTVAIICCLAITPAFAAEKIKYEKEILKAAKQNKIENITTEYIDNINMLIPKQAHELENHKQALKLADYKLKIYETVYEKNSIELRDAYLDKAVVAIHAGLANESFKALEESKKIAETIQQDTTYRDNINFTIKEIHSNLDNSTKAFLLAKSVEKDPIQKEIRPMVFLAQAGEIKKALKELKKIENRAIKTKNNDLLAGVYEQRIISLCEINNYKEMWKYIEKAENLLKDYPHIKASIDYAKIAYYREFAQYDIAREILNSNIPKTTDKEKLSYYTTLFDFENFVKNYKEAEKIGKIIEQLYEDKYPDKSVQLVRMVYDRLIDLYFSTNDYKKIEEYLDKYREITEPIRDKAPIFYAKYLAKLGHYQMFKQDYTNAKNTLMKSIKIYEEFEPKSNALAHLYINISNIEIEQNNITKAIKYKNKAIEHNHKYYSDTNRGLAEHYIDLAFLYLDNGNFEKGKSYLNKGITIYRIIFGDNNINTLQRELYLYYMLKDNNKVKEANELLEKITQIAYSDKVVGYTDSFAYDIAITNATIAVENKDKEKALEYLRKAQKVVDKNSQDQKARINHLKYILYKDAGNKFKAMRYKKLAGIED